MALSIKLATIGKYLDQPSLVNKLNKSVPVVLLGAGSAYCVSDTLKTQKNERKNRFIQNASVISFTLASALLATRGLKVKGKEIFEGLIELPNLHMSELKEVLAKVTDEKTKQLINNVAKGKILKLKEVKSLEQSLNSTFEEQGLINKIIPNADNNEGAFEELGKLSLLGLVPVIGGISGGVLGDVLTKQKWKEKFPDKIKEGSYQYLNNIFLCNVGAGISLVLMNKLKVKSKAVRFSGMLAGVIGVGLVAGNFIANFVGKNFINPMFNKEKNIKKDFHSKIKDLNSERHPEALDLSLHVDDIASVGFLSGFKWIGPILPILYTVSGYRAGIGYRNGKNSEKPITLNKA